MYGTAQRLLRMAVPFLFMLVPTPGCGRQRPPDLVLISLDTTRPDHLGPYGYADARTPNLDRFAQSSIVYEHAYATSSWTLPSHASMFTGLLPVAHGAQTVPDGPNRSLGYAVRPLDASFTTLAELLHAAGYRTAAVVAGPALRRELGVAQGFEIYEDDLSSPGTRFHGKRAEEVANLALNILAGFSDEPYFLFVNFFDPHAPYRPPPPWDEGAPDKDQTAGLLPTFLERLNSGAAPTPLSARSESERAALDALRQGYDAEIAYMDHHLGRLLDAIAARGRPTFVVITGDHGESFGEHNFLSHGAHLYEDNVRVPLIVHAPNGRPARFPQPIQNHGVFATMLAEAGLPVPPGVAPDLRQPGHAPLLLEVNRSDSNIRLFGDFFDRDLRALVDPPYKLIVSSREAPQLFDLDQDSGELQDLAAVKPELAAALERRLGEQVAANPPLYEDGSRVTLRPETKEALRALGYLEDAEGRKTSGGNH